MRIAIEGCGHGTLHAIYASVTKSCEVKGWDGVDLLIIGGDFQAVRNAYDLNTMSVPVKYRAIGDFHEYYSGKRVAPFLTIFVGGNHEASSHLQELYYGGWVSKNIYYLGAANVVRFGDLRIAGLSGIWKGYNYNKPHFERLPYTADEVKSLYHVREMDVRRLLLVRTQVDIGISHDWPRGIEWMGDYKSLFRKKDLFEADAKAGTLGSTAAKYVMDRLRPRYWFAAHLHCKFAATVKYDEVVNTIPDTINEREINATEIGNEIELEQNQDTSSKATAILASRNENEIDLDMDDDSTQEDQMKPTPSVQATAPKPSPETSVVPSELRSQLPAAFSRPTPANSEKLRPGPPLPPPPGITNKETNFLALDKCLPHRQFLQLLEVESTAVDDDPSPPPRLAYDPEWLAILRVFESHDPHVTLPPNEGEAGYAPLIEAQEVWVSENLIDKDKMLIPDNFEPTAPAYDFGDIRTIGRTQPKEYSNSQTTTFCNLLGIQNWFDASDEDRSERARIKEITIEAEARAGGLEHRGGRGRGRSSGGSGRGGFRGRGGRGRGRAY